MSVPRRAVPPTAPRRPRLVPAALGVLAVLTATPGVHLAERWLAPTPAVVVSHGLAVALLALAVARWRARPAGPGTSAPSV